MGNGKSVGAIVIVHSFGGWLGHYPYPLHTTAQLL
jgi:hypothetical protein